MITLHNITKDVPNQRILKGISCQFDKGLTFIVGDSGAGKSTLMNILSTVDSATDGTIHYDVNGFEFDYTATTQVSDITVFRAKHVGIIAQDFNLINGLSAYQNIEAALELAGISAKKQIIENTLSLFGLSNEMDKPVNLLSGGEKQRVAIARAISKGAEIILADEPTGNLDKKNTEDVFSYLKEISSDKIVIVVSHNLDMAKKYADRIICIQDGFIVEDTTYQQLKKETVQKYKKKIPASHQNHISWRMAKNLSVHNIRKFKMKFISMAIVIGFAFSSVASLFTLSQMMNHRVDDINYTYYDADVVNVQPRHDVFSPRLMVAASDCLPLYESDIKKLKMIVLLEKQFQ